MESLRATLDWSPLARESSPLRQLVSMAHYIPHMTLNQGIFFFFLMNEESRNFYSMDGANTVTPRHSLPTK